MNAVHDTLRTKAEDESLLPVMWSLYHAARYDVVGQCRQSIEALLSLFYEKAATSDMIRLGLELVRTTIGYRVPTSATIPNTCHRPNRSKWPLLHAVVLKVDCNQSPQKLYHRAGLHTIEKNYCPIMVHRFYYR